MIVYRVTQAPAPEFVKLNVSPEGFEYRLLRTADPITRTLNEVYVGSTTFADLRNQADFSDYSFFLRCFDPQTQQVRNLGLGLNRMGNVFALTKPSRTPLADYLFCNNMLIMLGILVPFADCPVADWRIVVPAQPNEITTLGATLPPSHLKIDGEAEIIDVDTYGQAREASMPKLAFGNGPSRDGSLLSFTVNVSTGDGKPASDSHPMIFFETTAGALLTARVAATEGTAACVVDLAGVPSGTAFKVKAGFKHFPGLADYEMRA